MNKCEKCGFLHYRTDPCRVPPKPIETADSKRNREIMQRQASLSGSTAARMGAPQAAIAKRGSTGASVNAVVDREGGTTSVAGTQALPVDTNPKSPTEPPPVGAGTGTTSAGAVEDKDRQPKFDRKAWMREYQRNYMRNVYRPKLKASKSNPNTPERNDE